MEKKFAASSCLLRLVEGDLLTTSIFLYCDLDCLTPDLPKESLRLIQKIILGEKYQVVQYTDKVNHAHYLIVPFSYQDDLLAVMTLCKCTVEAPWEQEDIELIGDVAKQASLALSQARLDQSLKEKQEQIRQELQVARQIQNNLLRQTLPKIDGLKIQACCYPAREVGGDFF